MRLNSVPLVLILVVFCSCRSVPKAGDYYRYGGAKYNDRDYAGAILDYDKAIKLSPKNVDAYFARGLAKAKKGNYNGAISDMQAASTLGNKQALEEIKRIEKESKINPAVRTPTGLAAVPRHRGVDLKWDINTDSNAAYYNLYMAKNPLNGYVLVAPKIRENYVTVEGLKTGVKYYFTVTSMSRTSHDIESPYSNEASATAK
jgi:tetratricopeptide (TPR) repeat protein